MNSTNIKVISEEIQRLKDQVHAIDVEVPDPSQATDGQILSVDDGKYVISDPELPATTAASAGDVLGLVGEAKTPGWITPYTPWDYSSTNEVNTGQKWIDGKDVYCKVFTGTFGSDNTPVTAGTISDIGSIVNCYLITVDNAHLLKLFVTTYITVNETNGNVVATPLNATYFEQDFSAVVYYTKVTPELTATRKKTTKKGE